MDRQQFGARICASILVTCFAQTVLAAEPKPPPRLVGPTIIYEPKTDIVLHSDDADRLWYPASLTKLMTAYLAFDAVKSGRLAWTDKVPLSENARRQPATRIGLRAGIELTVEQAVHGLILRSANDFAMALAELIGGSEEAFATLMNDTAKRLGMTRSTFTNPHGLPDPAQITTARDMAILARAVMTDFPDRAGVFTAQNFVIHRGTFHNQNDLLRTVDGADGMKTGFTCGAGYNIVASATREGRRVIVVVLGALNREVRSRHATDMIETAFAPSVPGAPAASQPTLAQLPLAPADGAQVHDMSRETRTNKCGNTRRLPVVATAAASAPPKRPLAKAKAKAAPQAQ